MRVLYSNTRNFAHPPATRLCTWQRQNETAVAGWKGIPGAGDRRPRYAVRLRLSRKPHAPLTHIREGDGGMPMPYRESGLIKAVAEYHAADTAEASLAGSPID